VALLALGCLLEARCSGWEMEERQAVSVVGARMRAMCKTDTPKVALVKHALKFQMCYHTFKTSWA